MHAADFRREVESAEKWEKHLIPSGSGERRWFTGKGY